MNCFYDETKEATKHCIHCNKAICNECYHSDYPEYCWSCGLDHDNRLENAEKDFQFPKMFDNKMVHNGGFYLFFGFLFQFVVELNNGFNHLTNSIFGGIVSLIFFCYRKVKFIRN
jgi:hypothetical protein